MIHMFALSSILGRVIYSLYPETNKAIRPFDHCQILPVGNPEINKSSRLYIMWSRDGNLDNRHGSPFEPNHFVPLLKRDIAYGFDSDDDLILSVDESAFLEQGSFLDKSLSSDLDLSMVSTSTDKCVVTEVIIGQPNDSQGHKQTAQASHDDELHQTPNSDDDRYSEPIPCTDNLKQNMDLSRNERFKTFDKTTSQDQLLTPANETSPRSEKKEKNTHVDKSPQIANRISLIND